MKYLIIGIVLGAISYYVYTNPREAGDIAKRGIDTATGGVEKLSRNECVKAFEKETRCYLQKPYAECDSLLVRECGLPGVK